MSLAPLDSFPGGRRGAKIAWRMEYPRSIFRLPLFALIRTTLRLSEICRAGVGGIGGLTDERNLEYTISKRNLETANFAYAFAKPDGSDDGIGYDLQTPPGSGAAKEILERRMGGLTRADFPPFYGRAIW